MEDESVDIGGLDRKKASTYVVLRPRYEVGDDPFSFEKFMQKEVSYARSEEAWVPRRDPKMDFKGRFERDREGNLIVPKRPSHVPKPGRMMREENRRTLTIPVIHRKHGVPPRATIYSLFRQYAYDYEVKIGVAPDDTHTNYRGDTVSYAGLFKALKDCKYYPLAPLQKDDIRERFERSLAALIYREVQSAIRSKTHKNMNHVISSWAINVRDYVRDYIRGSVSAVGKNNLKDRTMVERRSKQRHHPKATYKYGYANALWETGELESHINVLEVKAVRRLTSSKLAMLGKKEAEAEKARRNAEMKSRKDEEDRKRTDKALGSAPIPKPKPPPPPRPTSAAKTISREYVLGKRSIMSAAAETLYSKAKDNMARTDDGLLVWKGETQDQRDFNKRITIRAFPKEWNDYDSKNREFIEAYKEYKAQQIALNIASHTERLG